MAATRTSLIALALVGATLISAPLAVADATDPGRSGGADRSRLDAAAADTAAQLRATGEAISKALRRLPLLTVVPVDAPPSSEYGRRRDPLNRRRRKLHRGIDFAARRGQQVLSAGAGTVVAARRMRGYGRMVVIDHGFGVRTRYAHLQKIDVRPGDIVGPGDRIGRVGATGRTTGPHLHFEVRRDGRAINPREVMDIPTRHEWATSHSLRDSSLQL